MLYSEVCFCSRKSSCYNEKPAHRRVGENPRIDGGVVIMKYGMRKPSIKKSIAARTKGQATRAIKRAVIPGYGKKGMGVLHPKRALYNKVYHKTTFSLWDLFK